MTQLKKWNTDTEEWEPVIVGARGEGIPTGGTTGQLISKASNDDFDIEWVTVSVAPEIAYDTDGNPYLV